MQRHYDFSRFGLADGETANYYAAFDMGMEGLFTLERFIYRDSMSGEIWSLPFAAMRAVSARCFGENQVRAGQRFLTWDWQINVWLDEPLGDTEERDCSGDVTVLPTDARQLFEVAARLGEAMLAARQS